MQVRIRASLQRCRCSSKSNAPLGAGRRLVPFEALRAHDVHWQCAPVAQLDRAAASGAVGREFESLRARQFPATPSRWPTEDLSHGNARPSSIPIEPARRSTARSNPILGATARCLQHRAHGHSYCLDCADLAPFPRRANPVLASETSRLRVACQCLLLCRLLGGHSPVALVFCQRMAAARALEPLDSRNSVCGAADELLDWG